MVMGHSHCGGIRAFVEHRGRPDPGDFIDNWMSLIAPAASSLGEGDNLDRAAYLSQLERASVLVTLDNLLSFPWIKSRVKDRQLELLGSYFDVGTGSIEIYDSTTGNFEELVPEAIAAE
jgi:carbonic anhydrase